MPKLTKKADVRTLVIEKLRLNFFIRINFLSVNFYETIYYDTLTKKRETS